MARGTEDAIRRTESCPTDTVVSRVEKSDTDVKKHVPRQRRANTPKRERVSLVHMTIRSPK